MFIGPLRSAVPGQVIEGEHDTKFEPVLNRYRRAPGDIDPEKLSCTLKMRVSYTLLLFSIKESDQVLEIHVHVVFHHKLFLHIIFPLSLLCLEMW